MLAQVKASHSSIIFFSWKYDVNEKQASEQASRKASRQKRKKNRITYFFVFPFDLYIYVCFTSVHLQMLGNIQTSRNIYKNKS